MNDEAFTLAELWRKLEAIHEDVRSALNDHETRLRRIEGWMYAIPTTVLLALVSAGAAIWGAR